MIGNTSRSIGEYFLSANEKVRYAKVTGFSFPSGKIYGSTQPTPSGHASVVNLNS